MKKEKNTLITVKLMTNIKQWQQNKKVIGVTKGIPNQIGQKAVNILMSGGSDTGHFQVNSRYTSLELTVKQVP